MLLQRIATAAVLGLAVLVTVLLLPAAVTLVLLTLLILAGAWEWAAFAGLVRPAQRAGYVLAVAVALLAAWGLVGRFVSLEALLWTSMIWWALALGWVVSRPTRVTRWLAAIVGIVVLVPAWAALVSLYRDFGGFGPQWLLFALIVVWAADIGAYFVGRHYGRVRLAPAVSPGKTWEGVLGGLMAAGLAGLAGAWWFGRPAVGLLALCLGAALISVVGDLTESMFKRHAGIKDSGSVLPGHGGVLDRIDSVTAAAPLFALGLDWLS